jgi:hypothetical protein
MSLGVSYNQISSIDVNSLKEVTGKIFNRASEKSSALENFDLSKFNRVSQGTDLYGSQVTAAEASNIAMINSGINVRLNTNTLNSLRYLNAQASRAAMADVTGNIAIPVESQNEIKPAVGKTSSFGKLLSVSNLALQNKQA